MMEHKHVALRRSDDKAVCLNIIVDDLTGVPYGIPDTRVLPRSNLQEVRCAVRERHRTRPDLARLGGTPHEALPSRNATHARFDPVASPRRNP